MRVLVPHSQNHPRRRRLPRLGVDGTPGKLAKYPSGSTRITRLKRFRGHIGTNVASLLRLHLRDPPSTKSSIRLYSQRLRPLK
jgi:hypothetical protein